jgi:hypothetical protein
LNITVMVHRTEAPFFANMHGWQSELISPLTRKSWDRSYTSTHEPSLAFASDKRVERFWRDLDAGPLSERFTLAIDASISSTELIATAMEHAQSSAATPRHEDEALKGLFHLESGAEVEEGRRLADYLTEDGDHFGLIIQYPPRGMYELIPLPDSETVFAAIRSADGQPPTSNSGALQGVRGFWGLTDLAVWFKCRR